MVECDVADIVMSATLNCAVHPIAFMSRMLSGSKSHSPSFEKEVSAIIAAVMKWSHLLQGQDFTTITHQRSVSFV